MDRAEALALPLRALARWELSVGCARCRSLHVVSVRALLQRLPGDRTLGEVVSRLRCQACRSPARWAKIADGGPGTTTGREVAEVLVVCDRGRA